MKNEKNVSVKNELLNCFLLWNNDEDFWDQLPHGSREEANGIVLVNNEKRPVYHHSEK
jgi:hypothetical protein